MNRRQRDQNRANARDLRIRFRKKSACPNCGRHGSHFAPPCFGEEGFFMCDTIAKLEERAEQ